MTHYKVLSYTTTSNIPTTKTPGLIAGALSGLTVMVASSPFTHSGNVLSATGITHQTGFQGSIKKCFSGVGDRPSNSLTNLLAGFRGHYAKEMLRLTSKTTALVWLLPWLKLKHGPEKAALFFATALATFEATVVNPLDVYKSTRSVGQPFSWTIASRGSLGNGSRLWLVWWGWMTADTAVRKPLKSMNIDPNSPLGFTTRTLASASFFTSLAYPIERILRTQQLNPSHQPRNFLETCHFLKDCTKGKDSIKESTYLQTTMQIVKKQGLRGLWQGGSAKLLGNIVVTAGANVMAPLAHNIDSKIQAFKTH